jgi:hypothetical protein
MADFQRVFVVLHPSFGSRVSEIVEQGAVWIVDTPMNQEAAKTFWIANPERSQIEGVTTFKSNGESSPERILEDEIETIDVHHPCCTVPEIIGASPTQEVCAVLSSLGFNEDQRTVDGFRVMRSANQQDSER